MALVVGATVDYGRASVASVKVQSALDAATLSAIQQPAAIRADTVASVFAASLEAPDLVIVSQSSTANPDGSFSATATVSVPTTLMSLVIPSLDITRVSTAGASSKPQSAIGLPGCILLLDGTMQHAFSSRSNSQLNASKCDVHVNSNGTGVRNPLDHWEDSDRVNKAAIFVSNSDLVFGSFCAVGAIQGSVSGVGPSCSGVTPDPFIGKLPAVSPGACSSVNTYSGTAITGPVPGNTYCGNVTFTGNIPAGIYYIRTATGAASSKLTIAGGAQGTGVTFYFVDATATMDVTGSGTKLSAPTTGPYAGYLVFMPSDLAAPRNVAITSLDKNNWSGVVYTPNWNIEIKSWSQDTLAAICWVANTMVLDSESQVSIVPGPISMLRYADGSIKLSTEPAPVTTGGTPYLLN